MLKRHEHKVTLYLFIYLFRFREFTHEARRNRDVKVALYCFEKWGNGKFQPQNIAMNISGKN